MHISDIISSTPNADSSSPHTPTTIQTPNLTMSGLEEITLEHVPASHRVCLGLFRNVANAGYLQSQLLARNSDFEYAFIDASSVLSRLHLLSAVYKALTVLLDGTLKTPNVHSEIVCALSASNNVRYSFSGVSI